MDVKVGHERWLVSYSDFITLLFAFFVVMYSVSQVNESKYKSLADTLNAAFENRPLSEDTITENETLADLESLSKDIQTKLDGFPVEGSVALGANENWIELTLSSELLFSSGSAQPSDDAKKVFSQLAELLTGHENEVQVVGHTDNVPINNRNFPNNWALSSARAVSIVDFLAYQGMLPEQLSAVAFGEFRPVADNTTEDGRRKNRRVVIRISSDTVPAQKQVVEHVVDVDPNKTSLDTVVNSTSQAQEGEPEQGERSQGNNERLLEQDAPIKPVRLKGGDLLFTSDPNLPRLREIEESQE